MKTDNTTRLSKNSLECPITEILGIWKFVRDKRGYSRARSTPGHLLHLVISGCYRLRTNGRQYEIKAGDMIYYHEVEDVEWLGNEDKVAFYSVGFIAPSLEPFPLGMRVFPSNKAIRNTFRELFETSLIPESNERTYGLYGSLMKILIFLEKKRGGFQEIKQKNELWWRIEEDIRRKRSFRPILEELAEDSGYSKATVVRSCRQVTGLSPMKRIQELRMAEARGLLQYSTLNITQVARYLGYPRIHEFSREFSRYYKRPPSEFLLIS